jgi:hypothetical protein
VTKTQIKIYPAMKKLKAEFPSYMDGGFTWEEFAYIGLLESKNRYKFGRDKELEILVKDMKDVE